ncbi:hypothetical protein ACFQ3B_08470 [Stackebrandtia endophytica]|uniref:hypothetical protein n=1 Tax=Stackebrandtia endophytica TaxID=1496996 RepID=UPI001FE3B5B7|nr:hypothetical protein [Stackebrandtia endophytica]
MSDEIREWTALAKTAKTRARIRRWAYLSRVCLPVAVVGFVGTLLMIGVTIVYIASAVDHVVELWWAWSVALGIMIAGFGVWMLAGTNLIAARYADAWTSVGTVVDVVEIEDRDPEAGPVYEVTILAELSEANLRRVMPSNDALQLGQSIRFRHNTFEAENLDDVLFDGLVTDESTG